MKKSSALPKYKQAQLDDNRTLADQADASKPTGSVRQATTRPGNVVPIKQSRPTPAAPRARLFDTAPGFNVETILLVVLFAGIGIAIGIPAGAWMFVNGFRPW